MESISGEGDTGDLIGFTYFDINLVFLLQLQFECYSGLNEWIINFVNVRDYDFLFRRT